MHDLYYERFQLDERLSVVVKYAWYMDNTECDQQQVPDLLIPDGCPEIIFVLRGAYEKNISGHSNQLQVIDTSTIIGIQTRSALVRRLGHVRLVGLKFKPLGFYQLLGDKINSCLNKNILFEKLDELWLRELENKIVSENKIEKIIELISNNFLEKINRNKKYALGFILMQKIIDFIFENNGNISVEEIAKKHQKSIRQIQRYFKKYIALSPKAFCQIIRFKSLYKKKVLSGEKIDFFDYGFFDQMHFIKSFKANLGTTPGKSAELSFQEKNEIARRSMR